MIEKGIPIPHKNEPRIEELIPDLLNIDVGDSVLATEEQFPPTSHIRLAMFGIKRGRCHEARKEGDGYRIWRTK